MDVAWQRCISLCSSWQAVGGCAAFFLFGSFTPSLAGPSEELEWQFLKGVAV